MQPGQPKVVDAYASNVTRLLRFRGSCCGLPTVCSLSRDNGTISTNLGSYKFPSCCLSFLFVLASLRHPPNDRRLIDSASTSPPFPLSEFLEIEPRGARPFHRFHRFHQQEETSIRHPPMFRGVATRQFRVSRIREENHGLSFCREKSRAQIG